MNLQDKRLFLATTILLGTTAEERPAVTKEGAEEAFKWADKVLKECDTLRWYETRKQLRAFKKK